MREDLKALKPGDRVQVFDVNGNRMGQPRGGWDGEVLKVGRKLITVAYPGHRGGTPFRLDTGRANDAYSQKYLKTPEKAAADDRRRELVLRIRHHGVEVGRSDLPTDKLEAIVAILDAP